MCWTPGPRFCPTKALIWESKKNGRRGSLVASLIWLSGSHMTMDLSPDPCGPCFAMAAA